MTERSDGVPPRVEPYSPHLRTALVLAGTGTAGAYHAGVLRAFHEAGAKLDVVSGQGMGAVGALFAAIDGGQRLWGDKGLWRDPALQTAYDWRVLARLMLWALAVSVTIVALPMLAMAAGLVVYPLDFVLRLIGLSGGGLVGAYLRFVDAALAPTVLPTWLPRLVVLVLGAAAAAAVAGAWLRRGRPGRGAAWWRLVPAPLSSTHVVAECWRALWELLRGATQLKQPPPAELARRYAELLADNLGQPGFRELLIVAHDLDAHRDVVFALVGDARRRGLVRRQTVEETEQRRAEVVDLAGVGRDHLADAVAAALTVPMAVDAHPVVFTPDSYWRGETHRLCDRPAALGRLLDELVDLGVEQLIVVSAAPESPGPHALDAARVDGRGRAGEYLQSAEAAILRDATTAVAGRGLRVFVIRPSHNPIGPFDFAGGYDGRSARRQPLDELVSRGYEDAYRQFIEPVVGGSGDRVGQIA